MQVVAHLGDVEQLARRIDSLGDLNKGELLEAIGAEVEGQTRRRINEERTAPDGTAWDDWSENYAASRHGNQSMLMNEGDMMDSLQFIVSGDQVEVGTDDIKAGTHQFGQEKHKVPARPFLGLSDENLSDLGHLIDDWVAGQVKAA